MGKATVRGMNNRLPVRFRDTVIRVTRAQYALIAKTILHGGTCVVRGPEVRAANALMQRGLGEVRDDGYCACNSERWWFTLYEAVNQA